MKIVHIQTQIQTVFGVLDGDEVNPQPPITIHINRFTAEAFEEAHSTIVLERDKAAGEPPDAVD